MTPDLTEARRARHQRRRDRSRDEILAAARTVLLRDGIAAVTLDAVAREAGMSRTGLYYYFASKEVLVFELVFAIWHGQAERVRDAVEGADTGEAALGAIIRATVDGYAPQLDDFRVAYLLGQVSNTSGLQLSEEEFQRIRPINDMMLGRASRMLAQDSRQDGVEPRLLSFLAFVSALGVLTMKGLVESQGDPLLYSDEQMIEALSKVFAKAAR
ncbi:TetR family transcriptional regulator [Paracoccus aestuariivivens]|uniref:TetR family transcriptional regulator n=2 Tax=Paracoccus aestuariivivens TaxID=1820333 RepID=A0A6L6JBB9_9RHOB|nr:TetR family transcriptional regulator [Paracoccus aestuariivivens]